MGPRARASIEFIVCVYTFCVYNSYHFLTCAAWQIAKSNSLIFLCVKHKHVFCVCFNGIVCFFKTWGAFICKLWMRKLAFWKVELLIYVVLMLLDRTHKYQSFSFAKCLCLCFFYFFDIANPLTNQLNT